MHRNHSAPSTLTPPARTHHRPGLAARARSLAIALTVAAVATSIGTAATGCAASCRTAVPATLGVPSSQQRMEALMDSPGPVEVETVVGADWAITRAGLIDLEHPTAKAAGLKDGDEPIQILVHVLRHPTRGVFLIDSGAVANLDRDPGGAGISWLLRKFMNVEKLHVRNATADVVARQHAPIAGVLMTHLHLDHVSGLGEVPAATPVYIGPGETEARAFMHLFTQGSIDRLIGERGPLQELQVAPGTDGFGVLDLFGDGSVFAVLVPGHTPGSLAFVARTPKGPVLLTGDASHTRWGWDHDVGPGTFSEDHAGSAAAFKALRQLVSRHPTTDVRVGHQR